MKAPGRVTILARPGRRGAHRLPITDATGQALRRLKRHPASSSPRGHRWTLDLVDPGQWDGCHGPGIVIDALVAVGPDIPRLEVLGHLPGSIRKAMQDAVPTGSLHLTAPQPRPALYQRLQRADAALITLAPPTAMESCLPAKAYDCLAVGVPVIAVCPPEAALLRMPGAARFRRRGGIDPETISRERGVQELDRVLRAL